MLILWTWNMPECFYFLNWLLRSHKTKSANTSSHNSAVFFPLQSLSFQQYLAFCWCSCSILTITLRFPVCGKCYFIWARWCNERVLALVSGDLIWVLVLSITVWLSKTLDCPRFIASAEKSIVIFDLPTSQSCFGDQAKGEMGTWKYGLVRWKYCTMGRD